MRTCKKCKFYKELINKKEFLCKYNGCEYYDLSICREFKTK